MKIVFFSMMVSLSCFAIHSQNHEYFGAQNQEATFEIVADIILPKSKNPINDSELKAKSASLTKYILGQMRRTPENAAASYPTYSIKVLNVVPESDSKQRVTYSLSGKGVFKPRQLAYTFLVPLDPSALFEQSGGLCSQEKEVENSNYWYHWEPRIPGCPLLLGVHYSAVVAKLTYIPSTQLSFPDYANFNLVDGELRATYMFGLENYAETNWNSETSQDWGAMWYRQTRDYLVNELKFEKVPWTDLQISKFLNKQKSIDGKNWPTVEDFKLNTPNGTLRFRLFLGNSGLNHESFAFHTFLADSLFNENVVFYSGHSGIGKNVDLSKIEKLRKIAIPLSRNYQIYFWGGCVPYSYYTDLFFMRKQSLRDVNGTEKLDIVAYGNESVFTANDDQRLIKALTDYMLLGKRTSYQKIIGDRDRFFLGVSGDEDNPTE